MNSMIWWHKMPYVVGCSFVLKGPFCKYAFSSSIVIQSQWQKTDDYPGNHAKRFCFPHPGVNQWPYIKQRFKK